jgi:hypothetical protein
MRADRLHASVEGPFKHNRMIRGSAFQGLFKAYLRAFATTLLNWP